MRVALLLAVLCAACGETEGGSGRPAGSDATRAPRPDPADRPVPAAMVGCRECHPRAVEEFLGHGMSDTLAPLDPPGDPRRPPTGERVHPVTGERHTLHDGGGADVLLSVTRPDGGVRRQRVVGRIGAGIHDVSWVGVELLPDGRDGGHLFFLTLEQVTGHGLEWSPFMQVTPGVGPDMPLNAQCLGCHSTADVAALPGAPRSTEPGPDGEHRLYPGHRLGADALQHLPGLGCAACHGDTATHEVAMRAVPVPAPDPAAHADLGLERLGALPAPRQRDVCARCHLQGEAELALGSAHDGVRRGGPQPDPLAAWRPVLVPATPDDDFRFVGQLQRLSLSACFEGAPDMTCTSCHRPHAGVAAQGTAAFDARCLGCHGADRGCVRPHDLAVEQVTGEPARSDDGCVDCHVRRSQPFDLPHLRTADHWVRRVIPPPATSPMRAWDDPDGDLVVWDDGRLAEALADEDGRRWAGGLQALALARMGRLADAAVLLSRFPPSGSEAATTPRPPRGLPALETEPEFHHLRGVLLERLGDAAGARAAYGDALSLDRTHAEARLNRASLRLDHGDLAGALHDAEQLLALYPGAEKPWNVLARAAAAAGDRPGAAAALAQSASRWPSDAAVWHELGRLLLDLGETRDAREVLGEAARLQPSRPGLAADRARADALR